MTTKMVFPSGTKAPDADYVDGIDSTAFMRITHAANSITGFGGTGSATTVARSDHNHSEYYTKTEIDNMMGNIQSALSTINGVS